MATREYSTFTGQDPYDHIDTEEKEVTVDECINIIGVGRAQVKLCMLGCLAWLSEAMEVWVIVLLGRYLACDWLVTDWHLAVLSTVLFSGFGVGSVIAGRIADIFSRRTVILVLSTWCLFYGLLSAASPWFSWILFLRAMVGLGLGCHGVLYTYVAEFLPTQRRAKFLLFSQCIWALGGVVEVVLAILLVEPAGWRWWLAACSFPIGIFVLFSWTLPQNPRFALAKGNVEEARAMLSEMARKNGVTLPVGRLVNDTDSKSQTVEGSGWSELFSPALRRTTISMMVLWCFTIFCYYGLGFVSTALLDSEDSVCDKEGLDETHGNPTCSLACMSPPWSGYLSLLVVNSSDVLGTFLSMLTVDWLGRRRVLTTVLATAAVALFFLLFCWDRIGLLVLLFIVRFMYGAAMAIITLYTAEVFPTVVRASGLGMSVAAGRVGAVLTPFVAQILMARSMFAGMLVYTLSTLGSAVLAFFLPIETKGRPLLTR